MTAWPPPGPMTPAPVRRPGSSVAAMVERNRGEPGFVERAGEAVVATGVLGGAVGDEHDAAGRVDRPPAGEDLHAVGVDERPLVHQGLHSVSTAALPRDERKSARISVDDLFADRPLRRDGRAVADGGAGPRRGAADGRLRASIDGLPGSRRVLHLGRGRDAGGRVGDRAVRRLRVRLLPDRATSASRSSTAAPPDRSTWRRSTSGPSARRPRE